MIAQGDFQKLLLADTKERQGIFREIFKTGGYQILQEKLKAESGKLSDELEFARRSVNQYLEGVLGKEEINFAKLPMEEAIAAIKELIGRSGRNGKYKLQASESTKRVGADTRAFTKSADRESRRFVRLNWLKLII